ncbi:ABC transporter ATP-binding protein [Peribacillus alkalitolerans]|uniref:ABC transporter ATP-binding protein n=1 Tax=Peribacillus alkalitolerans TaxID=1550385 RepID=UPI0013CF7C5F|nr:ABC transporter ATP-binding protein [Peribacillus alkalitolerans]
MIEIYQLSKKFEDNIVVDNVSFSVQKGSIYGLLGSNGAGKTTLLKMLTGIYKQDTGQAEINGETVFENLAIKNKLIFMPDIPFFFSHYTVKQMADYYSTIYPHWDWERFEKLKAMFDIDVDKKVQRFSKGMQRQVAFWLAFSSMPDVVLLDEPFDGLDPVIRKKVKNMLVQDVADREMTVIISSHNLREVEDICDHIGILHKGQMMLEKDLDDLKSDVHKIQIAFKEDPTQIFEGLKVLHQEKRGSVILCVVRGKEEEIEKHFRSLHPVLFDMLPLTLEEIFIYEMGEAGYAIGNLLV